MSMIEQNILHFTRFSDMSKWSATTSVFDGIKTGYPLVKLSKILTRVKEPITVEDNKLYTRVTVRLYGQGVQQRDQVIGKDIGTKRQFIAHAGQLIISRIDARNGAFGIVPTELEGAIVTNDFWLFDVHDALPQYLMLVMSSELFQRYWQTQSSGTTNRQRVGEDDFLQSKIAFPPIKEQQVLLDAYNAGMKKADDAEQEANTLESGIDDFVLSCTSCTPKLSSAETYSLLQTKSFSKLMNWGAKLNVNVVSPKELFVSRQYKNALLSTISEINPKTNYPDKIDNITFFPMECISDSYGEIVEKRCGRVSKSKGYTRFQENDILWAKITPCMQNGKSAIAHNLENGFGYGSTEYHVIRANPDKVLPEYLHCFLRTRLIRKVAQSYFSGSAGQQRVGADFLKNLSIPLLPISSGDSSQMTQEKVVNRINEIKSEIKFLREKAERLRQRAKKEFEETVFDGR